MKPTYLESQSLMYYFIKVFFGPLMSVTVFVNGFEIIGNYQSIFVMLKNAILFNTQEINAFFMNKIYWFALSILFFVDTVVFMIGYLSELPLLNNKIRSVETSPFGVLICLACYAPIGSVTFLLLKCPYDLKL